MLPLRILGLLVILLAVQGLCKSTKSTEEDDYEGDTPFDEEDEEDEDENLDLGAVDLPPKILSTSLAMRVIAGDTVLLPCDVIHAENHAVAWTKDKEYLYFGSQPHITDTKRIIRLPNNSLVINNVSVSDSSNDYECTVFLQPHNLVITHRLLVDPAIKPHPAPVPPKKHKEILQVTPSKKIELNQGQSVTIGCMTKTQPPPEIKWFIENKKVNGYDPDVILNGNFITIKKANRFHSGRYQCLAEDGSEQPAMEAITVIVNYAPEIEVKRETVYSGTGIESEMICIVSAFPEAELTWYKDDREIEQKKGSVILHHGATKGNKTKHVLKILHTSMRDFGVYKCRAQNNFGKAIKSINLTGTPSQAKISGAEMTKDDTGIILKWKLESYSPITEYKLEYRRKGDEKWNIVQPVVKDGKGNQFIVEHPIEALQPGSYEAVLKARNSFGWSVPSEPHMFNGDYPPEMARKDGKSTAIQIRPPGTLVASILVVLLSCAFTSL